MRLSKFNDMKYRIIACIIVLFSACIDKSKEKGIDSEKVYVIPLNEANDHVDNIPIKLSEHFSSFEYLKLETSPNCLLGNGKRTVEFRITPRYIYSGGKKFLRKDGRFVHNMGKIGKGPGEYIDFSSIDIDTVTYQYFVLSYANNLMIYSDSNRFIKSIEIKDQLLNNIKYLGNNRLALIRDMSVVENPYLGMKIIDLSNGIEKFKLGNETFSRIQKSMSTSLNSSLGIGRICTWEYGNKDYYFDPLCDTIYSMSRNGLSPVAFIDRGKYRPSYETMADDKAFEASRAKYFEISSIQQIDSSLFIYYITGFRKNIKAFYAIYNQKNGEIKTHQLPDPLFDNDINILPVYSLNKIEGEDRYYFYIDAFEIINSILPKLSKMDHNMMSEENKKLYHAIKNVNINDNPILCIIH